MMKEVKNIHLVLFRYITSFNFHLRVVLLMKGRHEIVAVIFECLVFSVYELIMRGIFWRYFFNMVLWGLLVVSGESIIENNSGCTLT